MNLNNAKPILNRINRLFADVSENNGNASALERDLLKEYIRKLYEALDDSSGSMTAQNTVAQNTEKQINRGLEIRKPKKRVQQEEPKVESYTPEPEPAPVVKKQIQTIEPEPPTPPKPRIIEVAQEVEPQPQVQEKPKYTPPRIIGESVEQVSNESVQNTANTFLNPTPAPSQAAISTHTAPSEIPDRIRSIFHNEKSNDLSEKLAGARVNDLARAMAINERLLAQNELFGGSKNALDAALSHLNGLGSYEEAIQYLGSGAAVEYDWLDEERKPTARAFAKLVKRRYN